MSTPLIYVACTTRHLGEIAIEVDAHVNPRHESLCYVHRAFDLCGVPRESLYIDLLDRGTQQRHVPEMRAVIAAKGMRPLEIWKLKAKLREFEAGA